MYTGKVPGVISLVYDSLAASELDWVLPDLREAGIRATFFGDGELFTADLPRWKQVVSEGHALGNGALLALHLLKDRMAGSALLEEIEELQVLIAELSGDDAIAPMALVDAEGRMEGVKLGSGREISVVRIAAVEELSALANQEVVVSIRQPHPQVHQQVLTWLGTRKDQVRLVNEI